jgi:predicted small metal-binding protein
MAKVINCDCGYQARGESDEELVATAQSHIADAHPEMAGQVADADLLAMAEEV